MSKADAYQVFISYSHDEHETGSRRLGVAQPDVARAMYEALTDIGIRTAVDFAFMALGADYQSELHLALRQASVVVLIVTQESSNSKAVLTELETAASMGTPVVKFILDPVASLSGPVAADLGHSNHHVVQVCPPSAEEYRVFAERVGTLLDVRTGFVDLGAKLGTRSSKAAEDKLVSMMPRSATYLLQLLNDIDRACAESGYDSNRESARIALLRTLTRIAKNWPSADGHSWNDLIRSDRLLDAALKSLTDSMSYGGTMEAARLLGELVARTPERRPSVLSAMRGLSATMQAAGTDAEIAEFLQADALAVLGEAEGLRTLERLAAAPALAKDVSGARRLWALDTLGEYGDTDSLRALETLAATSKTKSVQQRATKCHELLSGRLMGGAKPLQAKATGLDESCIHLDSRPGEAAVALMDGLHFTRRDVELALRLFETGFLTPSIHNWDCNNPPSSLDEMAQDHEGGKQVGTLRYVFHWTDIAGRERHLPPKNVFRLVQLLLDGECTRGFSGGWRNSGINRRFDKLGFTVLPGPDHK